MPAPETLLMVRATDPKSPIVLLPIIPAAPDPRSPASSVSVDCLPVIAAAPDPRSPASSVSDCKGPS